MPIFRAVRLGQNIQHRPQVHIHPQPAQFFGLDLALLPGIVQVAGRPHRQVVRENRDALPEHDDPAAFMVCRHQQLAAQSLFQIGDQLFQLGRRLKIDAIENQPAGLQLLKMTDNLRSNPGPGDPDD